MSVKHEVCAENGAVCRQKFYAAKDLNGGKMNTKTDQKEDKQNEDMQDDDKLMRKVQVT